MNYIVIDQGTSSTKAFLIKNNGDIIYKKKIKTPLTRPKPFHVEIDSLSIFNDVKKLFYDMIALSNEVKILKVGMAVQRSTFLFWEKATCRPVSPGISWQDSRAHKLVKEYKPAEKKLWEITGTPLSPHFGALKFSYITRKNKLLRKKISDGELFFGPLSAFLTHKITGEPAIDETIACRTLLYNIKSGEWSKFATNLFNLPVDCLPPIKPSKQNFGYFLDTDIPLSLVLGDQQSSLIGQGGIKEKSIAANFGTSASIQYNVGSKPLFIPGLISSVLFSEKGVKAFMVEGTINACNALFYHLEKVLKIPHEEMLWDKRVRETNTNGVFIPGFNGISSPYWKTGFDDILIDLENNENQIIRAGMESIGLLANDILQCMTNAGIELPKRFKVGGGGAKSSLLQFIANLTKIEVGYFQIKDSTALGVFNLLCNKKKVVNNSNFKKIFMPDLTDSLELKIIKWHSALMHAKIKK